MCDMNPSSISEKELKEKMVPILYLISTENKKDIRNILPSTLDNLSLIKDPIRNWEQLWL